jgi:hypothetical protein
MSRWRRQILDWLSAACCGGSAGSGVAAFSSVPDLWAMAGARGAGMRVRTMAEELPDLVIEVALTWPRKARLFRLILNYELRMLWIIAIRPRGPVPRSSRVFCRIFWRYPLRSRSTCRCTGETAPGDSRLLSRVSQIWNVARAFENAAARRARPVSPQIVLRPWLV